MARVGVELYTIQHPSALEELDSKGFFRPAPELSMDNEDGYFVFRLCYRWMIDRLYERCGLPYGVSQQEYDSLRSADDRMYRIGWKMVDPADGKGFPYLALSSPCLIPHPVWAFQKVYGKVHARPDMRSWTTDEPEDVVRLRLDVPEDRLLFSDMEYWHIPLNRGYFPANVDEWEKEDELFDARCRSAASKIGIDINGAHDLFSEELDHIFSDEEAPEIAALQREFLDSWNNVLVDADELGSIEDPIPFRSQSWIDRETQCVMWEIMADDVKGVERFTTRKAGKR